MKVDRQLASFDTNLRGVADAATGELGQPFARGAVGFVYGFATILFGFLIMLATLFVLLRDGDAIRQIVVDMLPMPEADTKDILETLRSTAFAAIVGGLATSAIQGTLGGLAFWVTGVSSPLLWGFVMGVLSLLPVGGSAFVWAPVAAYFLATGSPVSGWFLVAFGIVVIGSSDNLLRPWLIRKAGAAGVHPLLLFFGVFSGIGLFGASGIVFGPLLAAFVLSVIRIYRQHFGRTSAARKARALERPTAARRRRLGPDRHTPRTRRPTGIAPLSGDREARSPSRRWPRARRPTRTRPPHAASRGGPAQAAQGPPILRIAGQQPIALILRHLRPRPEPRRGPPAADHRDAAARRRAWAWVEGRCGSRGPVGRGPCGRPPVAPMNDGHGDPFAAPAVTTSEERAPGLAYRCARRSSDPFDAMRGPRSR